MIKCINEETLNQFLLNIKESFEKIKIVFQTDKESNEIPDICEE